MTPNPTSSSASIQALLDFETESDLFSHDPNLSALSCHLTPSKTNLTTPPSPPFLRRCASHHKISRIAASIESEIQSWIDRETVDRLNLSLSSAAVDEKIQLLTAEDVLMDQVLMGPAV